MLESILPFMRCPRCMGTRLSADAKGVSCRFCGARYRLRQGILDLIGDESAEVITPLQRIMQSSAVVSIYERFWRPLGYFLASSRSFSEEVRTVLRFLREADTSRVLDVACGPGIFTRPLAKQTGCVVVGFDLSWPMLRRAQRMAERAGIPNIVFIRGTVFKLPFVSGAFTSVSCCGALHLFAQTDPALREIERVAGPGGHLALQTTIRPAHSIGLAYFLQRFVRFGFFHEEELREKLRLNGFKIVESQRHRISFTLLARHTT